MGERKGTNHYYPPDYDPRKGGLNKFLGTHALRERARKLDQGILIIRFEMPYNIWCDGCKNHIGMGVRYNAEKTKLGMYFTTPIYQFRMKCHLCDNHIEIKTDPGNLEYVIVSGARRQENRWDPKDNGQVVPEDKNDQKRMFDDAMFKLEHGHQDKSVATNSTPRISQLVDRNDSVWFDPFSANQALRKKFKAENKLDISITHAPAYAKNTGIKLLPLTTTDLLLANQMAVKPVNVKKMNSKKRLQSIARSTRRMRALIQLKRTLPSAILHKDVKTLPSYTAVTNLSSGPSSTAPSSVVPTSSVVQLVANYGSNSEDSN